MRRIAVVSMFAMVLSIASIGRAEAPEPAGFEPGPGMMQLAIKAFASQLRVVKCWDDVNTRVCNIALRPAAVTKDPDVTPSNNLKTHVVIIKVTLVPGEADPVVFVQN